MVTTSGLDKPSVPTRRSVGLLQEDDDDETDGHGNRARPSKMARLDREDDVAGTLTFDLDGKSYCSRAVQSSTEASDGVVRSGPLTKLPSALLSAIFEEAADAPSLDHLQGRPLSTALATDAAAKAFEQEEAVRRKTLLSIGAVSKQFRKLCVPLLYSLLVLPVSAHASYTKQSIVDWLATPISLEPRPRLPSPATSDESDDSDLEDSSWADVSPPVAAMRDASVETIGSLVRALVFKCSAVHHYTSLSAYAAGCPNLTAIHFTSPVASLSESNVRDLSRTVSPGLRHLHGLCLSRPGGGSHHDSLLALINYSSKLESFAIKNLALPAAAAARLLFILRLNARLRPSGAGPGAGDFSGIVSLAFGSGSAISRVLLEGLADAAPHLRHLHLEAGCVLTDDALNGDVVPVSEFDLTGFVSKLAARLHSLTLVCASSMRVRGSLERLPTACPNLVAAHIRSDQISYPFFQQLAGRGSDLAPGTNGPVEGHTGDVAAVKPGKLRLLRLQHSHAPSKPKDATLFIDLDGAGAVVEYAKLACQAESAGIAWPTDASQKDLLMRLHWMVQAIHRHEQPAVRPLPDQAEQDSGAQSPSGLRGDGVDYLFD